MKRVLTFILVLSMILGSIGMVFADSADGLTYAEKAIAKMVELGLVEGDEGGLRLDDPIRRSEVAVLAVRMAGVEDIAKSSNYKGIFSDVTPDMWENPVMNGAINVAAGKGLVQGYPGGTFQPNNDITNAEAITLMVRLAVSAEEIAELDKGIWPAAYITKAVALGLLEGTSIANYQAAATRETVFVLGYNANVKVAEEDYYVFKAIVLENDRVEKIGGDRVVVEVIREVQKAKFVEELRKEKEKGDQLRLDLSGKYDAEDLLGKVVDVSLDKNDRVVKIDVDDSYDYLTDKVIATKDKLEVGKTRYTVLLGERYDKDDERIFRTYLNNEAMRYEDFYKRYEGAEFARVTIKNGKVLFIDAFNFEDIAPVQEVKKDGEQVFVYNDARDGGIKRYDLKASDYVIALEEGVFTKAEARDIEAYDVIHEYLEGKTSRFIVRKDAEVEGVFEKVSEEKSGVFVHVDGKKYLVKNVDYKRPVYSYDSKEFKTLVAKDAAADLREFRNEDVTILLDLAGDLQYIGSNIDYNEAIAIIDDVLSRGDVRYVKANDEKMILSETFKSSLYIEGTTKNQNLREFDRGDLVFVVNDDDNIDIMNRLEKAYDIGRYAGPVDTNNKGEYIINKDYIEVDRVRYNLLNSTSVFILNFKNAKVDKIEGTTVTDVAKNAKKDSGLKAYVLTDKGFDLKDVKSRSRTSGRDDVAHTIVFTNYVPSSAKLSYEIIEVTHRFIAGKDRSIQGKNADGNTVIMDIGKDAKVENYVIGDIVELGYDSDDIVQEITIRIPVGADSYKVVGMDSATNYRWIELEDAEGVTADLWISRDVKEFVRRVAINDIVVFDLNKNGDIDVIKSLGRESRTNVATGVWEKEPDKTALEAKKAQANALVKGNYTAESWAALTAALALPESTQAEVDAKVAAIGAAIAGLKLKENGEPGPGEITAEAVLVGKLLGVSSYAISVKGATLGDVEKVKINGADKFFEIKDGVIRVNSGEPATSIKIVVEGKTINVTIK